MKLHASLFYTILPGFLQKWILKLWFLRFLRPSWKPRYLMLLGSYLYKFQDDENRNREPKGAPMPIRGVDVDLVRADHDSFVTLSQQMLLGDMTVFYVSTMRKKYYYACASREEALTWMNSLREAQQEAVTRSMGHAARESYPQSWTYFDSLGKSMAESKDRVRERMERSNLREFEMSNLTGGPVPRGYYG